MCVLRSLEYGQQGSGLRGVMPSSLQLCDQLALSLEMILSLQDVLLGPSELPQLPFSIHCRTVS